MLTISSCLLFTNSFIVINDTSSLVLYIQFKLCLYTKENCSSVNEGVRHTGLLKVKYYLWMRTRENYFRQLVVQQKESIFASRRLPSSFHNKSNWLSTSGGFILTTAKYVRWDEITDGKVNHNQTEVENRLRWYIRKKIWRRSIKRGERSPWEKNVEGFSV